MTDPRQSIQDEKISGLLHDAADIQVLSSAEVLRRFVAMENRMGVVEDIAVDLQVSVKENTKITTTIAEGTSEILSIFNSAKGGVKVLGWLGGAAKWVAAIATLFVGLYTFIQNFRGHR